ncbi:hypothetical protein [Mycolicibacterium sp. A43C]
MVRRDKIDGDGSKPPAAGFTIPWGILAVALAIFGFGSLGALAVVVSVKDVDTLSTVALALAVLSFAAQLIVTMAQGQQSAQVNASTLAALTDMRATTTSLLTNQRDQFNKVLGAALRQAVPAAVEDVSRSETAGFSDESDTDAVERRKSELGEALQARIRESLTSYGPDQLEAINSATQARLEKRAKSVAFRELLSTFPGQDEAQPALEILHRLSPSAIARFGEIASDTTVSTREDHAASYMQLARTPGVQPVTDLLVSEGLLERFYEAESPGRVLFKLTPTGMIAARLLRGRGPTPEWASGI